MLSRKNAGVSDALAQHPFRHQNIPETRWFMESEIRFSFQKTNGITLHVAEAGPLEGPLVVLLHGFPEFWYGWRHQIDALAQAGYHVLAPDQRGYNKSDKPPGRSAYHLDQLALDVVGLVENTGAKSFALIGHDWGSAVGWRLAAKFNSKMARFISMSAPHSAVWLEAIRTIPAQRKKSWYVGVFRLPWLPEFLMRLQNYKALAAAMRETKRPEACTEQDLVEYRRAWSTPGALTAMLNWYRAVQAKEAAQKPEKLIDVPAQILWGNDDKFGVPQLAEMSCQLCSHATVHHLDATHWIQHDEPDQVNQLILNFLDDWRD